MIIKKGQIKITRQTNYERRISIFNLIEKTEGAYSETLAELKNRTVIEIFDGTETVIDSISEAGNGFKVFPMKTAQEQAELLKEYSMDTIEWVAPLVEVSA